MLRTAVLSESGLRELLGRICEKSRLMAPAKRGKTSYDFQWIEDPADVQIGYSRTVLPPKQAFVPPREPILDFSVDAATPAKPVLDEEPFVLFGIHACDGNYLVEVLTEKGEALLKDAPDAREATAEEQSAAADVVAQRKQQQKTKINAAMKDLPDVLESQYGSDIFEQTAARCYSCGTCTNVCPTCFCFDVDDEVDLLLQHGTRTRKYDSCQFQDFALVAGGHNFRREREDRVRHRWFRKFVYLLREHGQPFCVGCGRCSSACTADISLVDVMNSVLAEAREEVAR